MLRNARPRNLFYSFDSVRHFHPQRATKKAIKDTTITISFKRNILRADLSYVRAHWKIVHDIYSRQSTREVFRSLVLFFFLLSLFAVAVPLAVPREFTCTLYHGTAQRTLAILWYNQWMTDCVPWRGCAGDRNDLSRALFPFYFALAHSFFFHSRFSLSFPPERSTARSGAIQIQIGN